MGGLEVDILELLGRVSFYLTTDLQCDSKIGYSGLKSEQPR